MDYLKAERLGSAKWRVLAIPFGGEFKGGKDSDGEYFSARTDPFGPYKDILHERPVVFHHGADSTLKAEVLGTEDELEQEADGWWANVWLNRSHQYHTMVDALLNAGKMYGSSGAVGHFVRKDARTGEILVWPHIEQTLTPTPANRLARVVPVKAMDHFEVAGIDLDPALRGFLTDLDSQPADLRHDLPTGGDAAEAVDLSTGGGTDAAIQRPVRTPERDQAVRKLASLTPRLEQLKNR